MHLKIKKKRCKHSLMRVDNKTIKYQEKCPKDAVKKGYCIEHFYLHQTYDRRSNSKSAIIETEPLEHSKGIHDSKEEKWK